MSHVQWIFAMGFFAALVVDGSGPTQASSAPVRTLEDIYGDTGDSFQGSIGFLNFQGDSTDSLATTGFGLAIDDMVVEWREYRLSEDTTDCALGQCAVLDLGTVGFFEGSGLIDVSLVDMSPYGSRCASDGVCSIDGSACSSPGACPGEGGDCESLVCFSGADCPTSTCTASTNDCNGNLWYFDFGDDTDCDNNGTVDLVARATSRGEVGGEPVVLNLQSGNRYRGAVAISAGYDVPGVLLVQSTGQTPDTVTVRYDDIDDGTGSSVCLNSANPAAQGEVTASTVVSVTSAGVVLAGRVLSDNADDDGSADDGETVSMRIELSNLSGIDLTGVEARLSTNDPFIDCVLDTMISFGDLAASEVRLSSDEFIFIVGDVGRTDPLESLTAEFLVSIFADQFDNSLTPQILSLELDLDFAGGGAPSSFSEGFESGGFGQFTTMHLDAGLGSLEASDGYRCQYSDPDWINSNSFGAVADCFVTPTGSADTYFWRIQSDRSFSGTNSLYFGIPLGDPLGFTTPFAQLQAIRTMNPVNLGWDRVCSQSRLTACADEGDCPAGEQCVSATPRLTFKHQVSMVDSRTVGVSVGEAGQSGIVQLQLADEGNVPVGDWIRLDPIRNVYDQRSTDNYTNCFFDPIDDGNTEDDFFDPTDPNRRLGPSSICFPNASFTWVGETFLPFAEGNLGNASDGPGLQGTGLGTWVESEIPLDSFRGRRARLRFLTNSVKLGSTTDLEQAFAPFNPNPGDDGWWIDDVQITDTLSTPATVSADLADNSGLPGCGLVCTSVDAFLVADPPTLSAPGQIVTLDATSSSADKCTDGVLQYRFWIDREPPMNSPGPEDTILRGWSDNPIAVDAPTSDIKYWVDVRCATSTLCSSQSSILYKVGCPTSGNLGGVFPRIEAPSAGSFGWSTPVGGAYAYGFLSDVTAYDTSGGGTGAFPVSTSFDTSGDVPAVGAGLWYLFKADGTGGSFCNEISTWSSGGVAEVGNPGRDSTLR